MHIKFLGTGSAFTLGNFQTNFLIEQNERRLLIDAGSDIRFSLAAGHLSTKDIHAVYLSHLHFDHAAGLEFLGFSSFFDPAFKERGKIVLYGNGELLRRLWDKVLSGSMESIQGRIVDLVDYFDVQMVRPNDSFTWEGLTCSIVQSIHIMNGFSIVPSYGLMVKDQDSGKTTYFTTDSQHCPSQIMDFYQMADYIIQDCETAYKSGVHANYADLTTLPPEVKAKMILVHYQDNVLLKGQPVPIVDGRMSGIDPEWLQKASDDGFLMFADQGMDIEISKDGLKTLC